MRFIMKKEPEMKRSGWSMVVVWANALLVGTPAQLALPGQTVMAQGVPAAAPATPPPAARGGAPQPPAIVSPEVLPDRRVVFRIYAPQATDVALRGGGRGPAITKQNSGVWETTVGPLAPGVYQYSFGIHGVTVVDPSNQSVNETTTGLRNIVVVPGGEWTDVKDVPHGAVAEVAYSSSVVSRTRRLHVYTPAGYEVGTQRLPVFYLLHGSGDSDQSWNAIGRAGVILDNLIASKRAQPMIVVMPNGHTRQPATPESRLEFVREFLTDIVPFVEKRYRVRAERTGRAIAGLSMGGGQTLNIAIPHLEKFAYVGVFSAGLSGGGAGAPSTAENFENQHRAALDNASLKKGLKLLWFSTGKEDAALPNTMNAVGLLKKHGFAPVFQESAGGHTWENWRDYLVIFAGQIFQDRN
jgi:enterochelin esterase family protein